MKDYNFDKEKLTGICPKCGNFFENCSCKKELSAINPSLPSDIRSDSPPPIENGSGINSEAIKKRAAEIIDAALDRQTELQKRIKKYFRQNTQKELKQSDEYSLLRAMNSEGIDQDQTLRDAKIIGLEELRTNAIERIGELTSSHDINHEQILEKLTILEQQLQSELETIEKFVVALENGEDRITATIKYLNPVKRWSAEANLL